MDPDAGVHPAIQARTWAERVPPVIGRVERQAVRSAAAGRRRERGSRVVDRGRDRRWSELVAGPRDVVRARRRQAPRTPAARSTACATRSCLARRRARLSRSSRGRAARTPGKSDGDRRADPARGAGPELSRSGGACSRRSTGSRPPRAGRPATWRRSRSCSRGVAQRGGRYVATLPILAADSPDEPAVVLAVFADQPAVLERPVPRSRRARARAGMALPVAPPSPIRARRSTTRRSTRGGARRSCRSRRARRRSRRAAVLDDWALKNDVYDYAAFRALAEQHARAGALARAAARRHGARDHARRGARDGRQATRVDAHVVAQCTMQRQLEQLDTTARSRSTSICPSACRMRRVRGVALARAVPHDARRRRAAGSTVPRRSELGPAAAVAARAAPRSLPLLHPLRAPPHDGGRRCCASIT